MWLGWVVMFVVGCTEYNLKKEDTNGRAPDTSVDTGVTDTSTPGDCSDFEVPSTPDPAVDEECWRTPDAGMFNPVLEWRTPLTSTYELEPSFIHVFGTPMVGHLTDDNLDGVVGGEGDIPDIAYTTYKDGFYNKRAVLRVISGDGTGLHFSVSEIVQMGLATLYPTGAGGIALGDLEGDGSIDIVLNVMDDVSSNTGNVCALERTGELKWCYRDRDVGHRSYPAIADMDGDGLSEVIVGSVILNSDGTERGFGEEGKGAVKTPGATRAISFAADMDQDGTLEVVAGNALYSPDGATLATTGGADGFSAVGNFDEDPYGEMVVVNSQSKTVTLYDFDVVGTSRVFTKLWDFTLLGSGAALHGGPPTVADFDGDGEVEVGVAGGTYYHVINTDGTLLWKTEIHDTSSAVTGSSVFDFDGDGKAEVVYADEQDVWVLDGETGEVRLQFEDHDSRTQLEYPVIADVDADGSTEIIVAQSSDRSGGDFFGIAVIGSEDGSWSPARQLWNQHAYSITNIDEDGSLPTVPETNWLLWNNFRAGGTTEGLSHWLPDLEAWPAEVCLDECEADTVDIYVPVDNGGLMTGESVLVGFVQNYMGVQEVKWTDSASAVPTGEGLVLGPFSIASDDWGMGTLQVVIDVDEALEECNEDNNTIDLGVWPCSE